MTRSLILVAALSATALLAGCGTGASSEPPVTQTDPAAASTLQFATGIATLTYNNTSGPGTSVAYGLNVVATLRQSNGLSGTLYNVPQIIGPSNFLIGTSTETGDAVTAAGSDVGTNHITWSTLNQTQWQVQLQQLKQPTTGVFGYGFCPCNQDAAPSNGTASLYNAFLLPIYGAQSALEQFFGGPPAFPSIQPSLSAIGFQGYSLGFTDFAVQPVIGTYELDVKVPPDFSAPGQPTPSPEPGGSPTPAPGIISGKTVLTSLKPLPSFAQPTFTADGKGGGSIRLAVPSGLTEAMAIVKAVHFSSSTATTSCEAAHEQDQYFTLVTHASGSVTLTLGDALSTAGATTTAPTICPGEGYLVYAAGFDYPAYESAYPQNLSPAPPIVSSSGRADVTTTPALLGTYPQ